MEILFLTENFPPERNAAASRIYERAVYWVKWGHRVTIITSFPNFPEGKVYPGYQNRWYQIEEMSGIRVVRVKTFISRNEGIVLRTLDFLSFMITSFVAGMFQKKPDVIVANSPQIFTAVAGWALSLFKQVPYVFELADLWPASIPAVGVMRDNIILHLIEKLELFLYRKSAAIVALTQSFKEDLVRRKIPADKITVVINGVDLPRFSPRPRDTLLASHFGLDESFVIGYIGTHGMAHGLENVLVAAEKLREYPVIRFLFVGTGAAKESLVSESTARGLTNVVFIPPQPKSEMPAFWSLCDVSLIHLKNTRLMETVIPSKIFEAMAMGLPILLAAPEGEASRIILRENAGLCIRSGNVDEFVSAVLRLRNDQGLYRQLSSDSHGASVRYTRERQATDMLEVLRQVIDTGRQKE
jgi:colanic acid biosynthesis glycosyl transferase WcaI